MSIRFCFLNKIMTLTFLLLTVGSSVGDPGECTRLSEDGGAVWVSPESRLEPLDILPSSLTQITFSVGMKLQQPQ